MLKKNEPFEHRGDVVAFVKEIRRYTLLADAVDAMVEMLQWPKVTTQVSPPTPPVIREKAPPRFYYEPDEAKPSPPTPEAEKK